MSYEHATEKSHYIKVGYISVTINVLSDRACNTEVNDTFLYIKYSNPKNRLKLQNFAESLAKIVIKGSIACNYH